MYRGEDRDPRGGWFRRRGEWVRRTSSRHPCLSPGGWVLNDDCLRGLGLPDHPGGLSGVRVPFGEGQRSRQQESDGCRPVSGDAMLDLSPRQVGICVRDKRTKLKILPGNLIIKLETTCLGADRVSSLEISWKQKHRSLGWGN